MRVRPFGVPDLRRDHEGSAFPGFPARYSRPEVSRASVSPIPKGGRSARSGQPCDQPTSLPACRIGRSPEAATGRRTAFRIPLPALPTQAGKLFRGNRSRHASGFPPAFRFPASLWPDASLPAFWLPGSHAEGSAFPGFPARYSRQEVSRASVSPIPEGGRSARPKPLRLPTPFPQGVFPSARAISDAPQARGTDGPFQPDSEPGFPGRPLLWPRARLPAPTS